MKSTTSWTYSCDIDQILCGFCWANLISKEQNESGGNCKTYLKKKTNQQIPQAWYIKTLQGPKDSKIFLKKNDILWDILKDPSNLQIYISITSGCMSVPIRGGGGGGAQKLKTERVLRC